MQHNLRFTLILLACVGLVVVLWLLLHGGSKTSSPETGGVGPVPVKPTDRLPVPPAPSHRASQAGRVDTGVIGTRKAVLSAPEGEGRILPGVVLGRVRGYDGQPAADAAVAVLQTAGETPCGLLKHPVRRDARTNPDGEFEIANLTLGNYSVVARTEGFAQAGKAYLSVEQPISDLDMKLTASSHVSGVVHDAAGQPLGDVTVWALQPVGAERFGLSRTALQSGGLDARWLVMPDSAASGADGHFEFSGLPQAPTYVLAVPQNAAASLAGPTQPPFDGLDIEVTRGGALGGSVVLGETGEPVQGVAVVANGPTTQERFESVTTAEGRFDFSALRPAAYELALADERYALAQGATLRVQVREGETDGSLVLRVVPAASVSGGVYDKESDEPLPDMYVAARGEGSVSSMTVETGSDGSYAITGMGPGDYRIFVVAPSLRYARASGLANEASVSLQQGQTLEGLDFRILFGAVVQGYVVDEAGSPVPYADVTFSTTEGSRVEAEKTDAQGHFACAGLTPGLRLMLQARKRRLISPGPVPVEVPSQGVSNDVTLVVAPGATVQGQVVRSSGTPVEGAPVFITATQASYLRINDVQPSGREGSFIWDGLPGGDFMVGVVARGLPEGAPRRPNVEVSVASGEQSAPVKLVWDGEPGEQASLEAGETGDLSIRGRVTDQEGNPVSGADINARSATGYSHSAKSFHDGGFEIAGVASGTYSLRVFHKDFAAAEPRDVQAGVSNLAVVLQPPATASGQVVDAATGQPIQEFQLAQASARYLEREASGPSVGWNRIFDPEGRFSVDVGIGRGAGVLIAKAEGYAPEQLLLGEVAPGQQITNLVFRLQSGAIVEGTVSDAAGNAVSGASIYQGSQERRGAAVARSDAGGAFRAEGLEAGSVELTASHPSYAPETVTVTTRLGAVTRADFVLSVGGAVEGYVTKGGQPVNRQTVSLNVGDRSENTVTGTDGYYSFERLPAGEGSVVVNRRDGTSSASQYLRVKRSIIIAENSVTRVDFEFAGENAVVEGVVTVEGGPASQAYIMLGIESGGGDQRTGTNVDANGYYRVENLSPGSATLEVSLRGGRQRRIKTFSFELQAGQRLRQDIDFGPVASIRGTVRGVRKGEQAHVAVLPGKVEIEKPTLEDVQAFAALVSGYTPVSPEGTFVVENLERGTYTVVGVAIAGTPETEYEAFMNARYVSQVIEVDPDSSIEITLDL
ncbi:MAG TPA: carboxypeptidase-like regulatory domain-containing protein [Candidatus Hydrogenedentes bacterium]|nr:carboxypeptidase-like regulatory domain-containing protein [Candidatus Hydrogenedentota bacterium]